MWIIKYLLLASIVTAAPDGRQKRHLAYFKDLFSSIFQPQTEVPLPQYEVTEHEYKLYKVPGFQDVLIKARPSDAVIRKMVNNPRETLQVNPFEAYIGSKNREDTRVTFQNVNNLLSTGILNRQQARLMKKTMVPVMSDLNNVQMKTKEIIRPAPVIQEVVKPVASITEMVKPVVQEIIKVEPFPTRQVVQINPYEAYIDSKNTVDNRVTFQNVNNLLTTETLNGQQVRLIENTMVPVMSGLNNVQMMTEEIINPAPVIQEVVEPVVSITEVVRPVVQEIVEEKLKVVVPFEPRYSYKQVEQNGDITTFSTCNFPDISITEIVDKSYTVPMCIRQRIEEVVSLGANPNRLTLVPETRPIHKPVVQKIKPLNPLPLPLDFNNGGYVVTESSVFEKKVYESEVISDNVKASQILGPMPPQFVSLNAKITEDSAPELELVNASGANIVESFDTSVKIQDTIVLHGLQNIAGKHGPSLVKIPYNLPSGFSMIKEKDESRANVNTKSPLNDPNFVYIPPVINELPPVIKNNVNIGTPSHKVVKTNNGVKEIKPTGTFTVKREKDQIKNYISSPSNIVKPTQIINSRDSEKTPKSLSQYISQQFSHSNNHSNLFTLTKEKEEADTSHTIRSQLPNNFLNIPNLFNFTLVKANDSNTIKPANDIVKPIGVPKEGTLAGYIYKMIVNNNTDEAMIIQSNTQQSNNSKNISAAKVTDVMPDVESISRYMYKQISHRDPNQFVMIKHGDKLQTTANTNAPMQTTTPVTYTTAKTQLYTNKANVESVTEVTRSKKPPVLKENDQVTLNFKNNPQVEAYSNYKYHKSNTDGSSIKVKANNEGVSVNVDANSQKGRGDIPEEN